MKNLNVFAAPEDNALMTGIENCKIHKILGERIFIPTLPGINLLRLMG
jgi:hypothetical protein